MATDIEIANTALMEIGVKPIASFIEATNPARRIALVYATARDKVLRDHAWNFATVAEALVEVSSVSMTGWGYVYQYPSKCLFVRKVYNISTYADRDKQDFKEVFLKLTNTKGIASNLEDAEIEYTYQTTDPSLFDPSFVRAFELYLASCVAGDLCADKSIASQMLQKYQMEIDAARSSNKSEGREQYDQPSSYEAAR